MPKSYLLFASFMFILFYANGNGLIQGNVSDKITKEPLIGASVLVKEVKEGASVSLSGAFKISISPGRYTLICSFVGYNSVEKEITVGDNQKLIVDFELEENSTQLNEIVVSGALDRTSDAFALHTETNSQSIINVMSAKTIQLMPDITVANILQRFSGVSVDRNSSGDAQYAIIRGMPQRYSYTLVNGIKIPSPDNKNRYVPMDLFPADLLDRLEVIKALTPSMEGDATGGVMNLVMKDAPSELTVTANAATGTNMNALQHGFSTYGGWQSKAPVQNHPDGYASTPNDFSYQNFQFHKVAPINQIYGFSIGGRLTKDKRLGAIFAGSVQDVYRSATSIFIQPDNQAGRNNIPLFDDYFNRQYSNHQKRYGLHFKADYRLSEKHKLKLYSMFVKLDEVQRRHTIDTSLSIGRNGTGSGNVYLLNRSKVQQQTIFNISLQGDHELSKGFKMNWSAIYSKASNAQPDWSEYQTSQEVGANQVVSRQVLYDFNRRWQANSDIDHAGYLNFIYDRNIGTHKLEISTGGLYRDKARSNSYYYYQFTPSTLPPPSFLEGTSTLTANQWQINGGSTAAMGNVQNSNAYTAHEKIAAGYVMGKILFAEKLEVLGGVRAEHTDLDYATALPLTDSASYGSTTYLDILPSIHFKYKLNPNQNLRLAYFRSINRQGFFELPPTLLQGDNFPEAGNPHLRHAVIDNLDARIEQFTRGLNQVLIGFFYKHLNNAIETYWTPQGTSGQIIQPNNVPSVTNFGFELAATQYWGRFGVTGNYTFTQSQVTTAKLFSTATYTTILVSQTRPLQGQAKHIGNLSFLYKDVDRGLNLQLAMVYTSTRIALVSPYQNLDYWQQPMLTMDFSVEKKIMNNLSFYIKVQNILNTPFIVFLQQKNIYINSAIGIPDQKDPNKILVQHESYGQNYVGGIRYKFSK